MEKEAPLNPIKEPLNPLKEPIKEPLKVPIKEKEGDSKVRPKSLVQRGLLSEVFDLA